MERQRAFIPEEDSVIGLAFPIAFFSSYPLVLDFIDSLPEGNGCRIFMSATMGGMGMGVEGKIRKMIVARGYTPFGAELFLMPGNYNNKTMPAEKSEKNKKLIDVAMEKARLFGDSLNNGTAKWNSGVPVIPSVSQWFVRSGRALRFFYRTFPIEINNDKCIRCMRCIDNCPIGAIYRNSGSLFIRPELCQSCQRCVGFCPVHAIIVPGKPAEQYRAMDFEEFIK